MKTNNKTLLSFLAAGILVAAVSCKKDNSVTADTSTVSQAALASVQAVAVAATAAGTDSVYIVNTCEKGQRRDSVAFSGLPSLVSTYLSANYAGYTFQKAFAVKESSGTITGYVVVIQYNGNPVGIKFDASGNFVKVLEQREGNDIGGRGWHRGGRFDDRDGERRDTIALNDLLSTIKAYMANNYPQDTLSRAFRNKDNSIMVVSLNNGAYTTVFNADGTFIKRVQLPVKSGKVNGIELSALPANAQSYLTTTYPNYVFKHAFKVVQNNTLQGYVVIIDANSTKYAVLFDASGNFVKAVTIR
jgi:hypothetical protein